jgi:hypothetical protein
MLNNLSMMRAAMSSAVTDCNVNNFERGVASPV